MLERLVENEQQLPAGTELLTIGQLERAGGGSRHPEPGCGARAERGLRWKSTGRPSVVVWERGCIGSVLQIYPAGFTKVSSLGVEQQRVKVDGANFAPEVIERAQAVGRRSRLSSSRADLYRPAGRMRCWFPARALFRGPDGGWQIFAVRATRRLCATLASD